MMDGQTKGVYLLLLMLALYRRNAFQNKKAFKSSANLPLSDSPCFIVNNFERVCVCGSGGGGDKRGPMPGPYSEND